MGAATGGRWSFGSPKRSANGFGIFDEKIRRPTRVSGWPWTCWPRSGRVWGDLSWTHSPGSSIGNLKELRPRSGRDVAIRLLFVFDPWSQAVLLVAGNKARSWTRWYEDNIPLAEVAYKAWLDNERERRGSRDRVLRLGRRASGAWR
ncbi:type II toxin-antitoxin system RelE/ParE family toxin [Micromonospora sicca]|uniref:type II toxin-antitoxin system RelE/ParE family toxin n=1 Tax=Micromonospora sicca TaxID=2202420 RepID=UPI003F65B666